MKRATIWKWRVRACCTILAIGSLSSATGCDQLEGVTGAASVAVSDAVANAIAAVVGGLLDSAVGGLLGSSAG